MRDLLAEEEEEEGEVFEPRLVGYGRPFRASMVRDTSAIRRSTSRAILSAVVAADGSTASARAVAPAAGSADKAPPVPVFAAKRLSSASARSLHSRASLSSVRADA